MLKKIKVNDTRVLNIGGISTNSPFTRVLDERDMRKLLETRPPLTGMYIVNSDGRMLPLTFENYKTGLQELFPAIKSAAPVAKETVVEETSVKEETVEETSVKEEPVVEETVEETPAVEEITTEEIVEEVSDEAEEIEADDVAEEAVAENNQNDNVANMAAYVNNKKNKKYRK